ncbi:MAG: N-acetylmuramoyl-L-alanine amidase [Ignavibacteriales bacterium]|nr:N-acetylmuramoyl-L-alanine amidase [Ignavibacteriales bacterium]
MDSTDIDTVYMTCSDSLVIVGLSQRSDYANSIGAAWFHSIHSDAGAASSNTTLFTLGTICKRSGESSQRWQGNERYNDW